MKLMHRWLHAALILGWVFQSMPALAAWQSGWDFTPTPMEWETWPQYCRVQYSSINNGLDYKLSPVYSPNEVSAWRETLGERTFDGLHHWCASIHFLGRARVDPNPKTRNFKLNRALEELDALQLARLPLPQLHAQTTELLARERQRRRMYSHTLH